MNISRTIVPRIVLCIAVAVTAIGCKNSEVAPLLQEPNGQHTTVANTTETDVNRDSRLPDAVHERGFGQPNIGHAELPAGPEASDPNGPTIWLDYSDDGKMNPIEDFMYFVPLVSPTLVVREISKDNTQTGRMVSMKRSKNGDSFTSECVFRMSGQGRQTCHFDPNQMIEHNLQDHEVGKPLKNILEYIQFQGQSEGRMVTRGRFIGDEPVVTDVKIYFARRKKDISPVTIQLYSVKPEAGRYEYARAYGRILARVDSISFQRTETTPKMAIEIASIRKKGAKENWWASFKATIANLLIPPLEVTRTGNDTMIEFGRAMYDGRNAFTFPRARNLLEKTAAESAQQSDAGKG